jgi:ubiquinone biosynthesis protein
MLAAARPIPIPVLNGSGLAFFAVLLALALVSARLLGIRFSWVRGLVAAFTGTVAGIAYYYSQAIQTGQTPDFGLVFGVTALLATMLVLVVMELAVRPSTLPTVPAGLVSVPHPLRALRGRASRGRRYMQILAIAARNGLNPYLRGRAAPDLETPAQADRLATACRRALEECGGVFVKLGQLLSTRPDLVPPAFVVELARLQDAVRTVAYEDLAPVLRAQLGSEPETVFETFDRDPVAAASIAQVHRATVRGGDPVIVKVARPGIDRLVERDLGIIRRTARTLAGRALWARRAQVVELADGFAAAVVEELDFRIEAANIEVMAASAQTAGLRVPRVYRELSGSRVLVMEWLDGVNVRDSAALLEELGVDRLEIARKLLLAILRQIMIDGIFHADPHPGNVLVLRDGTPALIDFGSVGRLDASQQSALRRIFIAFDRRDPAQMREALVELTGVRDSHQQDSLERSLSEFMARRLGPGMQPGAALLTDLLKMLVNFELALPGHVAAVFRALVTMEGTLETLAPGFRVLDEARSVAGDLLRESLVSVSVEQLARDELMRQLPILRRLPRRLDQLAATVDGGRLAVRVSLFEGAEERRFISGLAARATLAFVGAAFGVLAVLVLGTPGGPSLTPTVSLHHALGYIGLFVSTVLMLRVVVAVAREGIA